MPVTRVIPSLNVIRTEISRHFKRNLVRSHESNRNPQYIFLKELAQQPYRGSGPPSQFLSTPPTPHTQLSPNPKPLTAPKRRIQPLTTRMPRPLQQTPPFLSSNRPFKRLPECPSVPQLAE
ncbi:hypothetical protein DL95DRAFT_412169 [Leptodontidium sp. 2 PMI_412]|nr:hypothetical protein DL95DRAFT_412169 [Leptodontidium sp. 2 PMI_412]